MPECGYCKDCKWWGSTVAGCSEDGSRFCGNAYLKADTNGNGLETEPDFGCVQWEPKQEQP